MKLAIIVAMDEADLIGKENDLPWRISADLQFFKKTTMGKPIVMGRNTHESIGRPLPGRRNIVLTTQQDYRAEGCDVIHSIDDIKSLCNDADEVMIMGGASLYSQCFFMCDTLYLTRVHTTLSGDTWFPKWQAAEWNLISEESHSADEKNQYGYSFLKYERIMSS